MGAGGEVDHANKSLWEREQQSNTDDTNWKHITFMVTKLTEENSSATLPSQLLQVKHDQGKNKDLAFFGLWSVFEILQKRV